MTLQKLRYDCRQCQHIETVERRIYWNFSEYMLEPEYREKDTTYQCAIKVKRKVKNPEIGKFTCKRCKSYLDKYAKRLEDCE